MEHVLEFEVRDYECDLQGIVNNANYLHYLEHARHKLLLSKDVSFSELHNQGIDAVVVKAEIEYKKSLKSKDKFICISKVERKGKLKIIFNQKIYKINNTYDKNNKKSTTYNLDNLILSSIITTACIKNNKPIYPKLLIDKLF